MTKEPLMSARGHRVIQLELRRNKVGAPFSWAAGFTEVKVSGLNFVRMLSQWQTFFRTLFCVAFLHILGISMRVSNTPSFNVDCPKQ